MIDLLEEFSYHMQVLRNFGLEFFVLSFALFLTVCHLDFCKKLTARALPFRVFHCILRVQLFVFINKVCVITNKAC